MPHRTSRVVVATTAPLLTLAACTTAPVTTAGTVVPTPATTATASRPASPSKASTTSASPSRTAPSSPASSSARATSTTPSTSTPATTTAPAAGAGAEACLTVIDACFNAHGTTVDTKEEAVQGTRRQTLTFTRDGWPIVSLMAGPHGIGGGCDRATAPLATVVRVNPTRLGGFQGSQTAATSSAAVQYVSPSSDGTYTAATVLTQTAGLMKVGETNSCDTQFASVINYDAEHLLWTDFGRASAERTGLTLEQAKAYLASPDQQLALQILSTAHRRA